MNTTRTIYTVLGGIILVMLAYIVVMQPKVNAGNEILEIQQQIAESEAREQEHKDRYQIAVESKTECMESWNTEMDKEHQGAEAEREIQSELNERLGLILSRQAQ